MKIPWSGRAHNYNKKDIKYLTDIIKYADPLTQGSYLKKFEKKLWIIHSKKCFLQLVQQQLLWN